MNDPKCTPNGSWLGSKMWIQALLIWHPRVTCLVPCDPWRPRGRNLPPIDFDFLKTCLTDRFPRERSPSDFVDIFNE